MSRLVIQVNSIDGIQFKGKIVNLLCLFYLMLWILVPAFSVIANRGIFRVLFAVIFFLWICTAIQNLPGDVVLTEVALFGIFALVQTLYGFIGYGDIQFYDAVNYYLLFGFAINSMLYSKIDSQKLDLFIIKYSMILLFITIVTTLIALHKNGNVARLLTASQTNADVTEQLRGENIGAFDFIYGLVVLFPVYIIAFAKGEKVMKVLSSVMTVAILFCVIKSNFTTALLLIFVGIFLPFILNGSKNILVKIFIIVTIAIVVPIALPYFLGLVYAHTTSILAKEKINGLLLFMSGANGAEAVSSRVTLFKLSFKSFLNSPIIGVGGYYRTTTVAYVGKHAQFIDDLARYGMIGATPLLAFLHFSIKKSVSHSTLKESVLFPSIIIFVALGFLNPIYNYGILACFFIISTTMARYIDRRNKA